MTSSHPRHSLQPRGPAPQGPETKPQGPETEPQGPETEPQGPLFSAIDLLASKGRLPGDRGPAPSIYELALARLATRMVLVTGYQTKGTYEFPREAVVHSSRDACLPEDLLRWIMADSD